jgi:hypothetical protein
MAETGDIQAQLDALRASGAAQCDPVRFAYLNALAHRAEAQTGAIRQSLNAKISAAASELASRPALAQPEITETKQTSPLAELLAYISGQAHDQPGAPQTAIGTSKINRIVHTKSKTASASPRQQGPELKSVAYFRNEWSKLSTEQQLTQTLAQAPENAGPMNSQHLVLRSLERMRDIAPDYLQGFMSYIDTLIWLEHAAPTKLGTSSRSIPAGHRKRSQ